MRPSHAVLVGYWSFDGTFAETSGFAPAGTHDAVLGITGTTLPAFSSDTPGTLGGMSVVFDGSNTLKVLNSNQNANVNANGTGGDTSLGPNPDYLPTFSTDLDEQGTGMTIAAWVKIDPRSTSGQNDWEPYISKNGEGGGYQLRRHSGSDNSTFTVRGTQAVDDPQGAIVTADGEWNHVVGTWDQVSGVRRLYVNGVEDVAATQFNDFGQFREEETGGLFGHGNADWEFLVFGGRDNSGSWSTTQVQLDEIRIYNEAISALEVATIASPDAVPEITIEVNKSTGEITLFSPTDAPISGYSITSETGQLDAGRLPGDFNLDGDVDAADYTIWRDNFGGDAAALNGNGTGGATVTANDYEVWRDGFGGSGDSEGWESLAERAVAAAGFVQGTGSGDGWEVGANPNDSELEEYFLTGESVVTAAGVSLGFAYGGGEAGLEDLDLAFRTGGNVFAGRVVYTVDPPAGTPTPEPGAAAIVCILASTAASSTRRRKAAGVPGR
ncbi:MAG: LamG domain-containing protein [Planctomycetota bacterium]